MTGIITSLPPLVEQPPGQSSSNPAGLPGVTYTVALLNIPQTWGALQTFPTGMISIHSSDIIGINIAAVSHQWINSIVAGVPTLSQPAFTDISGAATLAQLPAIGANTVLGSIAGGAPIALTTAQHTTLVNTFTTALSGAAPASGGGTVNFLRADGTFAAPGVFTSILSGAVPASGGGTTNFLRADGTFAAPGGSGTVTSVTLGAGYGISVSGTNPVTTSGTFTPAVGLTSLSNIIGADVNLNNTANFFTGPTVAQGTTGTFFAVGTVTLTSPTVDNFVVRLWDGTTVISSTLVTLPAAGYVVSVSVSGIITTPAGNIRIDCKDITTTSGKITFNSSGLSKDSSVTVARIA